MIFLQNLTDAVFPLSSFTFVSSATSSLSSYPSQWCHFSQVLTADGCGYEGTPKPQVGMPVA